VRSAGDVGDGRVAASRGCFGEKRAGPGQPRWVGGTATMGRVEGLTSFFFLLCVGGVPPEQPEIFFICANCRRPGDTHTDKRKSAGVNDDVS